MHWAIALPMFLGAIFCFWQWMRHHGKRGEGILTRRWQWRMIGFGFAGALVLLLGVYKEPILKLIHSYLGGTG